MLAHPYWVLAGEMLQARPFTRCEPPHNCKSSGKKKCVIRLLQKIDVIARSISARAATRQSSVYL